MCASNSSSLQMSYMHLGEYMPILAIWLADVPKDMLAIFDDVLKRIVLQNFPHYSKVSVNLLCTSFTC
jgi:DNA replication licensing factor MCM2